MKLKYEVYVKSLRRVVFQAPEEKDCLEWIGKLKHDKDIIVRKIK